MSSAQLLNRMRGFSRRLVECLRIDRALVVQMIILRVSLPVLKRVVGIRTLARLMWSPPVHEADEELRHQRIAQAIRLVTIGGRLLVSGNCLERSLVLYRLLARADAEPVLVVGARRAGVGLAAHAWIEIDGKPFGDRVSAEYDPVVAFGTDGSQLQGFPSRASLGVPGTTPV